MMTIKADIRQILMELLTLNRQVQLTLPANTTAIHHQQRQMLSAQQRLRDLEELVQDNYAYRGLALVPSHDRGLRAVILMLRMLKRRVNNLLLLAEEYTLDPAGAIACLRKTEQTHQQDFQAELEVLSQVLSPRDRRFLSPDLMIKQVS